MIGAKDLELRFKTSGEPASIPLSELIRKGPGKSEYVTVTQFVFGERVIIEREGTSWKEVWIPLFPPDAAPSVIEVIVETSDVRNQEQLRGFRAQQTITGLCTGTRRDLTNKELGKKLRESYPGLGEISVWVVEDVPEIPGMRRVFLMFAVAGVLLSVGGVSALSIVLDRRRRRDIDEYSIAASARPAQTTSNRTSVRAKPSFVLGRAGTNLASSHVLCFYCFLAGGRLLSPYAQAESIELQGVWCSVPSLPAYWPG